MSHPPPGIFEHVSTPFGRALAALGMAAPTTPSAAFATEPVAVAEPAGGGAPAINRAIDTARAERVALGLARSIPAVRKAEHVLATIATFDIAAWAGNTRLQPNDPRAAWLAQPDPTRTRFHTLRSTVSDLVWKDRSVWRIVDRTLYGRPTAIERIHPSRLTAIFSTTDPDQVTGWTIDGAPVAATSLVVFDAAGLGGLDRWGYDLLKLFGELQTAAGRYARSPHPYAILKNHGADLSDEEIRALLDSWELARETRGVAYLNDVVDYEPVAAAYSPEQLQLTEAREHATTEVARLFGLPAAALDAKSGDSMTYANVVDRRRDLVEALRPWITVIEQTLSLDDRRGRPTGVVLPHGITVRLDVDAYTRDDADKRMTTWKTGIDSGVLTVEEARASEPLARS